MLEAKNNVVMILGASPSVGKSFLSTNLAAVVAQAGQKVILIDADMRKGYSHKLFKLNAEQSLSCNLIGDINTAKAINHTDIENLDFISRGKIPPNLSELLMGERFSKLITELSTQCVRPVNTTK